MGNKDADGKAANETELAADEVSFIAKRERSSFTNNTAVVTAK